MAANRFNQILPYPEHVSSYVPLPLNTLYAIGKDVDKQLDDKINLGKSATDLGGKNNIYGSIKNYGDKGGIEDFDLGYINQKKNQEFAQLDAEREGVVNSYLNNKIDKNTFNMQTMQISNKGKEIFNRYNAYTGLAKGLEEQQKQYTASDYSKAQHLANPALEAGTELRRKIEAGEMPSDFTPIGIGKYVDISKDIREQFTKLGPELLQSYASPDGTGYLRTKYREGLTEDKIAGNFLSWYSNSESKRDIQQQARHAAKIVGIDPNTEVPVSIPTIGKDGKLTYVEETMPFMEAYETQKINELRVNAAGFSHSKGRDAIATDATFFKNKEEEDANKAFKMHVGRLPADPDKLKEAEDGAISANIKDILPGWEMKDGKLSMTAKNSTSGKVLRSIDPKGDKYIIDGKEYTKNNLPEGWEIPGGIQVGTTTTPNIMNVAQKREFTENDKLEAYSKLKGTARRLGVDPETLGREETEKVVGEWFKQAYTIQNDFTRFDVGTANALSSVYGATINSNGVITNPGQLAFTEVKDLNGNVITGEELSKLKGALLNKGKIVGSATSIINENYKPGDMYMQSGNPEDPKVYVVNTGDQYINQALTPGHDLAMSMTRYATEGKRTNISDNNIKSVKNQYTQAFLDYEAVSGTKLPKQQKEEIKKAFDNITGYTQDAYGNQYFAYNVPINVAKSGEKPKYEYQTGVLSQDESGIPTIISLSEAKRTIDESYMKGVLPHYNPQNFNRETRSDVLGQELSNESTD